MKGRDRFARAVHVTAAVRRVVVVRVLGKKTEKAPRRAIELALRRAKECAMSRAPIAVREAAKAWLKDPEFRAAYQALEEEFAFASALIEARASPSTWAPG